MAAIETFSFKQDSYLNSINDDEKCQKVGQGYWRGHQSSSTVKPTCMCLWCNEKGKVFRSTKSAQKHMIDKGHCKMLHEGDVLLEYTDFYDYRSSYPDFDSENEHSDEDMEVDTPEVDIETDGFELLLPSGPAAEKRCRDLGAMQRMKSTLYQTGCKSKQTAETF